MTHWPPLIGYKLWRRLFCGRGRHLFQAHVDIPEAGYEVLLGGPQEMLNQLSHLECDACGLKIYIKRVELPDNP